MGPSARNLLLSLIAVLGGCAAQVDEGGATTRATSCIGKCDGAGDVDGLEQFEYVVVGSGAGGGPLAANLARAGHSVLLLEAGEDSGANITYQVPAYHTLSTEDPDMQWDYYVDHYDDQTRAMRDSKYAFDEDGNPLGILYPRAGTLGGCTAHNAMITVTPHERDWDQIAVETGDESWRGANMRRYFERLERNRYLGVFDDRRGHGFRGWLHVQRPDAALALRDPQILGITKGAALGWVDYTGATGLDGVFDNVEQLLGVMRRDLNQYGAGRDAREGVHLIPLATNNRRRNGTREYLLQTVEQGHPLAIRTRALVTNVVFADEPGPDGRPRAIGVDFIDGRSLYRADPRAPRDGELPERRRVTVSREVILSAGAFNTPQLLMLSGIGPREELERHGIPVRVESPGVGRNLQDRYEVGVVYELGQDLRLTRNCTYGMDSSDPCFRDWQQQRGPYGSNGTTVAIVHRSSTALTPDPDLFVFGVAGFFRGYHPGYSAENFATKNHFTWAVLKAHTGNDAGTITLRSTDPRDRPRISFHYFDEGRIDGGEDYADLNAVMEGVELVRAMAPQINRALIGSSYTEVFPGPAIDTREELATFVQDEAWGHHASCTARIGVEGDAGAVLDSRFNVRGTTGLRVVDASVFPNIPGFFIVVPVFMVSEKAADTILEDIGER